MEQHWKNHLATWELEPASLVSRETRETRDRRMFESPRGQMVFFQWCSMTKYWESLLFEKLSIAQVVNNCGSQRIQESNLISSAIILYPRNEVLHRPYTIEQVFCAVKILLIMNRKILKQCWSKITTADVLQKLFKICKMKTNNKRTNIINNNSRVLYVSALYIKDCSNRVLQRILKPHIMFDWLINLQP